MKIWKIGQNIYVAKAITKVVLIVKILKYQNQNKKYFTLIVLGISYFKIHFYVK